jgi:hypothetical protein
MSMAWIQRDWPSTTGILDNLVVKWYLRLCLLCLVSYGMRKMSSNVAFDTDGWICSYCQDNGQCTTLKITEPVMKSLD